MALSAEARRALRDLSSRSDFEDITNEVTAAIDAATAGNDVDVAAMAAHISDASDAHDASAISVLDVATIYTAVNVETALAEVKVQANLSTTTITSTLAIANATPSATFDNAVGAKTLTVRKSNQVVSVSIPTGSTADGGGVVIASDAALAATFRPAADQVFPCIVTDNSVLVLGKVTIKTTGVIEFAVGAAGAGFTDDAAAGWPALTVSYVAAS